MIKFKLLNQDDLSNTMVTHSDGYTLFFNILI